MSLLAEVVAVLEREQLPYALIGAAAMALHGVSRSTVDVDLLTVEPRALNAGLWEPVSRGSARVRVLKGDFDDALAGSVRIQTDDEVVDVVVGRHAWQRELIASSLRSSTGEVQVPVARAPSLVLLKLFAGGPKDMWDVRSLLETSKDAPAIVAEVDRDVSRLSPEARRLWEQVRPR